MINNTCSICEETYDKCECVLEYVGMDIEVAALMQEVRVLRAVLETTQETRDEFLRLNNIKAERIVALEQSMARAWGVNFPIVGKFGGESVDQS